MPPTPSTILALDVGDKRIGIAAATTIARLAHPLMTLERNDGFFAALKKIVDDEDAGTIVVGRPRNLSGQDTAQTQATDVFVAQLQEHFDLPVHYQDEAVTSAQAEAELQKSGKMYTRGDIDALAATYILEDFLAEYKELT